MFVVKLCPWDNKGSQVRSIVWMDQTNLHQSNIADLEHKSNEHRKNPFSILILVFWARCKTGGICFVCLVRLFVCLLTC